MTTLAQVMACCLTAPIHHLNRWWLIISEVHIHIRAISQEMPQPSSITKTCVKITCLKCHSNFPGANELTHCPLGDANIIWYYNFQTHIKERYLEYSLWNCLQVNATRPYWWLVNISSGNGLVSPGNKPLPEPMLIQIYVAIWCH